MTLDRYLLKQFLPVFLSALALFMMLILLIDLFFYLTRYLSNGASLPAILKVSLFYIPKCASYALPVSLLFASAYTLGDLSAKNELVTITGSGVPFWRFCVPLIAAGILASFFAFFFEDQAVIPALRVKKRMARELLHTNTENFSDIVIRAGGGRLVYAVDYYDAENQALNGVTIIELDEKRQFLSMLSSSRAEWKDSAWSFSNPVFYSWRDGFLRPSEPETSGADSSVTEALKKYREEPETFRRSQADPEDLNAQDAGAHIEDLRKAGLPVSAALADYHHRFSFSAVSFVVVFLSLAVSGGFKKNIMLMSLLSSLGTAVIYYVIEMVSMMSAKAGLLSPFWGAWLPVFVCTAAGVFFLRAAKT